MDMASSILLHISVCFILAVAAASAGKSIWSTLNDTADGRLYSNQPVSRPCFSTYNGAPVDIDEASCAEIRGNYSTNAFRIEIPGAYQLVQDEACVSDPADQCLLPLDSTTSPTGMPVPGSLCNQGSVPSYYIEVKEAGDAIAAFEFARTHNVTLVIKNSGHDYLSRNSQKGSLALWVHTLKGLQHHEDFTPESCGSPSAPAGRAITAAAGETTGDIYVFASAHNSTFVGGYSGTIAASGGYVTGGGHSVLAPVYGMAADRVVQFRIVTPDGELRTANRCQNPDLFFALRGGGGGTFGVVLEATHRVEPAVPIAMASIKLPSNITADVAMQWVELQARESLRWGREGWGGHVAGSYLAHMNPLPAIANMSDGGAAARESMRRASEFALALGGTSEVEVMSDWLALWNKYLLPSNQQNAGVMRYLSSRLVPQDMFADDEGIEKIMGYLRNARELGFDPKSFYFPVGTPFVADTTIGKNQLDGDADSSDDHGTSVHPAWYSSLWSMSSGVSIAWNATYEERLRSFVQLTSATKLSEALTGPEGGAYTNEVNPFTEDWKQAWWGPHYDALLETKRKYDPYGLLNCWKCVGFEDSDALSQRFRCHGKLQEDVYAALR